MFIFRIEDKNGIGPYVSSDTPFLSRCTSQEHPSPKSDGIEISLVEYREYKCGFQSLDSLLVWFEKYMEQLEERGFFVSVYKIKAKYVRCGRKQIVFNSKRAIFVDSIKTAS